MTSTETDVDILAGLDFAPHCQAESTDGCTREAVGIASVDCPSCGDHQPVPLCGEHYRHTLRVMVTYTPGFECFKCSGRVEPEHVTWRPL